MDRFTLLRLTLGQKRADELRHLELSRNQENFGFVMKVKIPNFYSSMYLLLVPSELAKEYCKTQKSMNFELNSSEKWKTLDD